MKDLHIRNATPEDALEIAQIHVKTWQCAYRGQIPDSYLDSLSIVERSAKWKEQLTHPQSGLHASVAELDGTIIGWCTFGVNTDVDAAKEWGELHALYIDSEYIGKGVGSQLMDEVVRTLRKDGYTKATLWVLDTNQNTRRFYERRGWKIEGGVKDEPKADFFLHEIRYIRDLNAMAEPQ